MYLVWLPDRLRVKYFQRRTTLLFIKDKLSERQGENLREFCLISKLYSIYFEFFLIKFSVQKPKKLVNLETLKAQQSMNGQIGKVSTMSLHKVLPEDQQTLKQMKQLEKNKHL